MPNKKKVFVISLVLFSIFFLMSFAQAQTTYSFTINNNEDETEGYELSADMFSEYISFNENPAYINAGDSKTITLTAKIPCENAGSYSPNFIIYAQNTKETIKIPFNINVPSCYGYEVQAGENIIAEKQAKVFFKPHEGAYELCVNEKASIPVLITNAAQARAFKFKLEGIDFAKLSGKELLLKANQKGVLYVSLEPGYEGNYTLDLGIITDKARNIPIDLRIKKCYSVWADLAIDNIAICGCEPSSYDFFVGNNGLKKEKIGLKLEGPEWVSLGITQDIELEAGKNGTVGLNIDAPCTARTYDADIIAYLADNPDIKAEEPIIIAILSKEDCYKTEIETSDRVRIDYNGISLPVKIINYGAARIDYSVVLEGQEWVKADNNTISLEPGEIKTINLGILPGEDIKEGNYKIKIKLDSEKASYSKEVIVRLRKESTILENISNNIAKWYNSYYRYFLSGVGVILVLVIVLFLILSTKKARLKAEKKRKRRIKIKWLKWLLVLLVLAGLAYLIKLFDQTVWGWILWYRYYIYTLVALVIAVYLIRKVFGKRKKRLKKAKKIEEKKTAEKNIKKIKKPKKHFRYFFIVLVALILAAIFVYFSVYYNLLQYVSEFLLVYYLYIIAGIVLLIILILLFSLLRRKTKNKE